MEYSFSNLMSQILGEVFILFNATINIITHTFLKRRPAITNNTIALMLPMIAQNIFTINNVVDNAEEYILQLPQIGLHELSESSHIKSSWHIKVHLLL